MELDCVLPLKAQLKTSSPESAITILSALSAYPPNTVRYPTLHNHNSEKIGQYLCCVTAVRCLKITYLSRRTIFFLCLNH